MGLHDRLSRTDGVQAVGDALNDQVHVDPYADLKAKSPQAFRRQPHARLI